MSRKFLWSKWSFGHLVIFIFGSVILLTIYINFNLYYIVADFDTLNRF